MYTQAKVIGSQLKGIAPIEKRYLDKQARVIIIFEEENYDTVNDPDWIMPPKDYQATHHEAYRELAKGDVVDFQDLKKEFENV